MEKEEITTLNLYPSLSEATCSTVNPSPLVNVSNNLI